MSAKWTELDTITGANVASNDKFCLADIDADESKSIEASEVLDYIELNLTTLSNNLSMGNHSITNINFIEPSGDHATVGFVRMRVADSIAWRNSLNNRNSEITFNLTEQFEFVFDNVSEYVLDIFSLNLKDNLLTNVSSIVTGDTSPFRELLIFEPAGAAVNEFTMRNANTGNTPTLAVSGNDSSIGMHLRTVGDGVFRVSDESGNNLLRLLPGVTDPTANFAIHAGDSGTNPLLTTEDQTEANVPMDLQGKGTGDIRITSDLHVTQKLKQTIASTIDSAQNITLTGGNSVRIVPNGVTTVDRLNTNNWSDGSVVYLIVASGVTISDFGAGNDGSFFQFNLNNDFNGSGVLTVLLQNLEWIEVTRANYTV